MAATQLLWLILVSWSWGGSKSQSFPRISFNGHILASHSYVDLSEVGNGGHDSLQCVTDLASCCSTIQGRQRGDWYFPDGTTLPFFGGIYESRGRQRVYLFRRNNANPPTGIYRCDVGTNAVHHYSDGSLRATIYVGLYTSSQGAVSITGGVTYDLNTRTFTCISTGGPATNVTWTRDSTLVTEGTQQTVLNDPATAQYTHTLTLTAGELGGLYTCTVANNKPSIAWARISVPVVGLEKTLHYFSESASFVEICTIIVTSSMTSCPISHPFTVTLTSSNESAVSPADYEALNLNVTFSPCEKRHCVNVSIVNDLISEPEERFTISLSTTPDLSHSILVHPATGEVIITDDDDKPVEVTILPVNATGVRVSWSGSVHLYTSLLYTVYCSSSIMRQYERVYPPGVTSADIVLEDDITLNDVHVHNFTLYYITPDNAAHNENDFTVEIFNSDKSVFQIQFGPFYYCLDQIFKKIVGTIEPQLKSYLIDIIRKGCPECYSLTPNFLRPGMFLCHTNPTKTTYRTTLVNPFPTTNSTHLVGIIQSWVSGAPSLVLDGLLVRVNMPCPTSIQHLDAQECETGTSTDSGLGNRITQTLNICAVRNLGKEICSLGGCPLSGGG